MNFDLLRLFHILRPVSGQTLTYNGTAFVNTTPASRLAAMEAPTIASGVITITDATAPIIMLTVDTQAAAASDDLDTIDGGGDGQIAILRAANNARTVVVKDSTGNMQTAGDFSLDHSQDTITLALDGATWRQIASANNNT